MLTFGVAHAHFFRPDSDLFYVWAESGCRRAESIHSNYDNVNNFKLDNLQYNTIIKKVTLSNNFPNSEVLNLTKDEDINKFKEVFSD